MRLTWDTSGSRRFESGVSRGVFYPATDPGVPWNGLTAVKERVEKSGNAIIYHDGRRTVNQIELGTFAATIEALTYPDEFELYDGYSEPVFSGQLRKTFNFSYCTFLGDDILGPEAAYRLHLVSNCLAEPTERDNETLNSDILEFSWDITTTPIALPYNRPTSHVFIDSDKVLPNVLAAIETILYGGEGTDPRFPGIAELLSIFEANALFTVIDNGDGTVTVIGSDEAVHQDELDSSLWTLDYISVVPIDEHRYQVSSY